MSLRKILTGAGLTLGLLLALSPAAFAQEQQQQPAAGQQDGGQRRGPWDGRGGRRHGMGKRGPGGIGRLVQQLNLTDAQQQQMRAIRERYEAGTKSQREEMRRLHESTQGEPSAETRERFQALRAQLDQSMRSQHEEMLNVLTTEQRAQFEQLIQERKARQGERRGRRMNQQDNDDNN